MKNNRSQAADLVLTNGHIITVDDKDTIAGAIAVAGNKIINAGSSRDIESFIGKDTKVLDLSGRSVLPGFIDAHAHLDCFALHTKLSLSCHIPPAKHVKVLGGANNCEEILSAIQNHAQEIPSGSWIIAQGRFNLETNGKSPTREQLDRAAPDHPVILRYSAHTQLLNSKGLDVAGIGPGNPDPDELNRVAPGAKIIRNPETGEPTGRVIEAFDWIFPDGQYPASYNELKGAIHQTAMEAVSLGITSLQEFTCWPDSTRIYQELYETGELPLRIQFSPAVWGLHRSADLDDILRLGIKTGFGNQWLKFGSIKIFVDVEGIGEDGIYREWPRISQKQLDNLVMKAHRAGIRVMMHATSQEGQHMAIDAVAKAVKKYPRLDHRHRIEHICGEYWPEGLVQMKQLGIIPVPTPYSSLAWYGDTWLDNAKPGDRAVIYQTLLDQGFMPPGNSDVMGTETEAFNPWWSIWCVVERKTRSGRLISPEEGISVMDAIRLYTRFSAFAGFEESVKGAIEPGKMADLIVVDRNPLQVEGDEIQDIQVVMTVIDGQIKYKTDNSIC
ncbi:MAG: amidohydrolase [Desulfobacterales bacterium]|nr:amidohydrolase [Desulfobacterales bacterium]